MTRVLLLDNHDSFTYNLAELLRRNNKVTFEIHTADTLNLKRIDSFDKILISPGPGLPHEHALIFEVLSTFSTKKSIFGVCLGMQAMALHFGGELFNLDLVVHGQVKEVTVLDKDEPIFKGVPEQFQVGLYHSWAVKRDNFPEVLQLTALSKDGIIMGLRHRNLDIRGVQFHPESIMTPEGQKILDNWIEF